MKKLLLATALVSGFLVAERAFAKDLVLTQSNNDVSFIIVGNPGALKVNGTGGHAFGSIKADAGKMNGVVKVDMSKFTTDMDTRDEHMKDKYLEVKKFPMSKLEFKDAAFKEGGEQTVQAMLTIKNETKPVQVKYSISGGALKAAYTIDIKQFPSIGSPSFLGITMTDKVNVMVEGKI